MEPFFGWILDQAYHWVVQYGYIGLFILLMLGVVGIPIPDEILLTYAGYLIYKNDMQFFPAMAAAFIGAVCGITLSYGIGHTAGIYLVERYGPRIKLTAAKMDRVHRWFERMGRWTLTFGYFFPGIRHLTAIIAGSSSLQFSIFAVYAYIGAFLWTGVYMYIGYAFGERWDHVFEQIRHRVLLAVGLLVALILGYYLIRQWRQKRTASYVETPSFPD